MTNYLIRRGFQMVWVVFFASIAIYALLNAVPGGPLSGLRLGADVKTKLSDKDIARIEAMLGLNKPVYLAYATWFAGEDWVDEVGNMLGNPGNETKMFKTGTWSDFQSPKCIGAGGTNVGADPNKSFPCSRGLIRGDFGTSWKLAVGQSVSTVIGVRISNTVKLMSIVTVVSLLIALPIGILSAVKQYSMLDYGVTSFSFFGIAMPNFWYGLLLIILFGLKFQQWELPYFPTGNVQSTRILQGSLVAWLGLKAGSVGDRAVHLILPVLVLSTGYLAGWSRFMRSSMLEVLRQDYVRTARAKGLLERTVIAKHAVRNALLPLITVVVFQIPGIFNGAIVTETIFNYPGMGRLVITALQQDDWPIVMAILFISAILVVVATLVGDILYTIVDPRIRFE